LTPQIKKFNYLKKQ